MDLGISVLSLAMLMRCVMLVRYSVYAVVICLAANDGRC